MAYITGKPQKCSGKTQTSYGIWEKRHISTFFQENLYSYAFCLYHLGKTTTIVHLNALQYTPFFFKKIR